MLSNFTLVDEKSSAVPPPTPVTVNVAISVVNGEFVAGVCPIGPAITQRNLYPVMYDNAVNEYELLVAPVTTAKENPPSVDLNH